MKGEVDWLAPQSSCFARTPLPRYNFLVPFSWAIIHCPLILHSLAAATIPFVLYASLCIALRAFLYTFLPLVVWHHRKKEIDQWPRPQSKNTMKMRASPKG